jgi:plastocyanin
MTRTNIALTALLVSLAACGGNGNTPTNPTPPGAPGPSGATITILANGTLNPSQVDVSVGQSVTIVNQDSRNHQLSADPHPSHSDCPTFQVLTPPGQTRVSNAFPTARNCGFHDHLDPSNNNLLGVVRVQ